MYFTLTNLSLMHYFEGKWEFERSIYHSEKNLKAVAHGEAIFEIMGCNKLSYDEKGTIHFIQNFEKFNFTKSFLYSFDNEEMCVLFNDGISYGKLYQKYLLDVDSQLLIARDKHLCRRDKYDAKYSIQTANSYRLSTQIIGLNKDEHIETIYRRIID